ncbi:hypothetical protein KZ849_31470, partial [Pseudomonas aeruginosa]|nr:hypothetical protein [Pseudomonas aeruginosa]
MTWPAEAPLMSPPQRLRAGLLRGCLRLLFRGLVRPPMPVALQRGVLRGLSPVSYTHLRAHETLMNL